MKLAFSKQQEAHVNMLRELCLSDHDPRRIGKQEAALRKKYANQPQTDIKNTPSKTETNDIEVTHDSESELDESSILSKYPRYDERASDDTHVRSLDEFTLYDSETGAMVGLDALNDSTRKSEIVAFGFILEPFPEALRQDPAIVAPPAQQLPRLRVRSSHPSSRKPKARGGRSVQVRKPQTAEQQKRLILARNEAFSRAKALLDSQTFPFRIGEALDVISLGEVYKKQDDNHRYHTHKCIYPVGFKTVRVYFDVHDPTSKARYTSEIVQSENGPVFRVSHISGEPSYDAASSSKAWLHILEHLNSKRKEVGIEAKGSTISGPEMFGFAHRKVADLMEGLEGVVTHCEGYVFRDMDYASEGDEGSGNDRKGIEEGNASKIEDDDFEDDRDKEENTTVELKRISKIAMKKLGDKLIGLVQSAKKLLKNDQSGASTVSIATAFATSPAPKSAKKNEDTDVEMDVEEVNNTAKPAEGKDGKEEEGEEEVVDAPKELVKILKRLAHATVTFDTLINTGVGKMINNLRKHPNDDVSTQAKRLKATWKTMLEESDEKKSAVKSASKSGKKTKQKKKDDEDDEEFHIKIPLDEAESLELVKASAVSLKELMKGAPTAGSGGKKRNSSRAVAASKSKANKDANKAVADAAAEIAKKKKQIVNAAERCIKQLQKLMGDLEGLAVTDKQLIDSGLGKVVTKITKLTAGKKSGSRVVDAVAVAVAQGKALRHDWMKQLEGLASNKGGVKGVKAKGKSTLKGKPRAKTPVKQPKNSPTKLSVANGKNAGDSDMDMSMAIKDNNTDDAQEMDVDGESTETVPIVLGKVTPLKRVRVKLGPVKSFNVSYARYDATLYLVTEKAHYRIAGPRVVGSPSKIYFNTFAASWTKFEMLYHTAELLVSTVTKNNRELTLEVACMTIVESTAKSATKKLWLAKGLASEIDNKKNNYSNNSITVTRRLYLESYALILSEMTRLDNNAGAVMESVAYLRSTFGKELQAIGIREARAKGTLEKIPKGKKKRLQNGGNSSSFNSVTVEDLSLVPVAQGIKKRKANDEANRKKAQFFQSRSEKTEEHKEPADVPGALSVRPAPRAILFDPALVDAHALVTRIHDGSVPMVGGGEAKVQEKTSKKRPNWDNAQEDFALTNQMLGQKNAASNNQDAANAAAIEQGGMFATMLTLYHGILSLLPLLNVDEEDIGSFRDFRRQYVRGELDYVHAELFRVIASSDTTGAEESATSRARTRRQSKAAGNSRLPTHNVQHSGMAQAMAGDNSVDTSSFAYDVDDSWPPPVWATSPASWPVVLQRGLVEEYCSHGETEESLGNFRNLLENVKEVSPSGTNLSQLQPDLLGSCDEILARLSLHPCAYLFSEPVENSVPGYTKVITRPMDFSTIRHRLHANHYSPERTPTDAFYSKVSRQVGNIEHTKTADQQQAADVVADVADYNDQEFTMCVENAARELSAKRAVERRQRARERIEARAKKLAVKEEEKKVDSDLKEKMEVDVTESVDATETTSETKEPAGKEPIEKVPVEPKSALKADADMDTDEEEDSDMESEDDEEEDEYLSFDRALYEHDCEGAGFPGFLADMRQVWRNCRSFNEGGSKIVQQCQQIEDLFVLLVRNVIDDRNPSSAELPASRRRTSRGVASVRESFVAKMPPGHPAGTEHKFEIPMALAVLPTPQQVLSELVKGKELGQMPLPLRLSATSWILDQALEAPACRIMIAEKKEKQMLMVRAENETKRQETRRDRKEKPSKDELEKRALHVAQHVEELADNTVRLRPVGRDRYFNRYWVLDSALQQVGWLLVEHVESGLWGYYDKAVQINQLIDSLDERGKRESVLKRRLENRKHELEECMGQADELVTSQLEAFKDVIERGGITAEYEAEREELVEKIALAEADVTTATTELAVVTAAFELAVKETTRWAIVATAESKPYYYVKGTQQTQWDKPADLVAMEKAEATKVQVSKVVLEKKEILTHAQQLLETKLKQGVDPKRTMVALGLMIDHDRLISRIVDEPQILPRLKKTTLYGDVKDTKKGGGSSVKKEEEKSSAMGVDGGNKDDTNTKAFSTQEGGPIDGLALNEEFVLMSVRRSWWRTVRRVVSMLLSTEHTAAGPKANPNLCPIRMEWINNEDMRERWVKFVEAIAQPPIPTDTTLPGSSEPAKTVVQNRNEKESTTGASTLDATSTPTSAPADTASTTITTTIAATTSTDTPVESVTATPTTTKATPASSTTETVNTNESAADSATTDVPVERCDWAEEPDRLSILASLRDATEQLFDLFVGDPEELKRSSKAQMAVQRINMHEWRFKRALTRTHSVHDIALLIQWLQELLTVTFKKRRVQVETRIFNALCDGKPIDLPTGGASSKSATLQLSSHTSNRSRSRSRVTRSSQRSSGRSLGMEEEEESEESEESEEDEQAMLAAVAAASSGRRTGGLGGLDVSNIIFASRSGRSTRARTTRMVVSDDGGESEAESEGEEESSDDDDKEYFDGGRLRRKRKAKSNKGRASASAPKKKAKTMQTTTSARGRQTRRPVSYADGATPSTRSRNSSEGTDEEAASDDDDDDESASGASGSEEEEESEESEEEESESEEERRPTRSLRTRARVSYTVDDDDDEDDESD